MADLIAGLNMTVVDEADSRNILSLCLLPSSLSRNNKPICTCSIEPE